MEIESDFSLLPTEAGRYSAFPTLVRCGKWVIAAARTGCAGPVHGDQGNVRLLRAPLDAPAAWEELTVDLSPWEGGENNLDAILSGPVDGHYFLATRRYHANGDSTAYLTAWEAGRFADAIAEGRVEAARIPIRDLLGADAAIAIPHAAFGHIREDAEGGLLMTTYGMGPGESCPSPWLLRSVDQGRSWSVWSHIAASDRYGCYLNECSIWPLAGRRWLAVIRTDEPPFPLYCAVSEDNARSWGLLEPTGLFGHAPMLGRVGERLLLLYRDLSGRVPGVSLAEWCGGRWLQRGALARYTGGIYNGGYGDLLALDGNRLLVLSYLCDAEQFAPRIDGWVVRVPPASCTASPITDLSEPP